jgi:hypothetical protein
MTGPLITSTVVQQAKAERNRERVGDRVRWKALHPAVYSMQLREVEGRGKPDS